MQVRNLRAPQMTPPMVLEETDAWDRQRKFCWNFLRMFCGMVLLYLNVFTMLIFTSLNVFQLSELKRFNMLDFSPEG